MSTATVIHTLAFLVLIGQVIAVVGLGLILFHRRLPAWAERLVLPAALVVAVISTGGSLYFSEVAQLTPCELCWFQRIIMYPQVVLLGLSLIRKEKNIAPYVLTLVTIGAAIAVYHISVQLGVKPFAPCPVSEFAVSCTRKQIIEFGYITIPVMALTGFVLIGEAMVFLLRRQAANQASPRL